MDSKVDYIPAEFAVLKFSLKNGVKRLHHRIIRTKIELGYFREYMETSEKTHKLKNDLPEGNSDYKEMCRDLINFLNHGDKSKKLPPLYTSSNLKTIVPCLFRRMADAADLPVDTFTLYCLDYLLGSYCAYFIEDFPDYVSKAALGEKELSKDAFMTAANVACPHHSDIGAETYCSQSLIHQWVFTFCDCCCHKFKIPMLRGIHFPENDIRSEEEVEEDVFICMQRLTINNNKPSTIKSASGVSEAYRQTRSARSRDEDERRKNTGGALTIIYHGDRTNDSTTPSADEVIDAAVAEYKPIPGPKMISKIVANKKDVPKLNDQEFPSIGSVGRGRGKRRDYSHNKSNGNVWRN